MGHPSLQGAAWALARTQHGVITHHQLLDIGFSRDSIKHRIKNGRLHRLWRGVYAVGRPQLTQHGRWMAAVLACGLGAALSHYSAAALASIRSHAGGTIHVSVPSARAVKVPGIVVHRRATLGADDVELRHGIPVTTPACTLLDLATCLPRDQLEAAIGEADRRDLISPDELLDELNRVPRRPGTRALREVLERPGFAVTDSKLERLFLPIARSAGLGPPLTGEYVNGWKVDFYWPDLGLVVETDGLRYHRTPHQQERDRIRDQAHAAAGLTTLRFTRAQVRFQPNYVEQTLGAVARRLRTMVNRVP